MKHNLREEQLHAKLREIRRSGVVYLSTVPPYMKPIKLRQILSRFGEVGRIYLAPEDPKVYKRRVRSGGNKKRKYTEGWVEFKRKRDAKIAVQTLNGNKIGGNKGSFYYDDILNMQYLKKFKWTDLTEQIALESQERQERLKLEISQATRENNLFIANVEKKALIDKIIMKKPDSKPKNIVERNFSQRPTKPKDNKMPDPNLSDVLSKVF